MHPELTCLRLREKAVGTDMDTDEPFELAPGAIGFVTISSEAVPDSQIVEFTLPGPNHAEDPLDVDHVEADLHDSQVEVVTGATA